MNSVMQHIFSNKFSATKAMEHFNDMGKDLTLFIVDDEAAVLGTLTDGDIRRGLIKGLKISDPVDAFMNKNFRYLPEESFTLDAVRRYRQQGISLLPILDAKFKIKKLINFHIQQTVLPVDAVIMAGGEGARLRPLTVATPKPLLKVGEKPIIEHNVDRLVRFGVNNLYICVNYLGEQVIDYFEDGSSKNIQIQYVTESKKLGTIGALSLINDFRNDSVLVMNADLLTNLDFEDFYRQFADSNADLMVASIPYTINVPYATFEINGRNIISLKEKPTFTYYSNAGIYLVKKEHLAKIPREAYFNATDFIELLIAENKRVLYSPILEFWLDIGSHEDYVKANENIKHIRMS